MKLADLHVGTAYVIASEGCGWYAASVVSIDARATRDVVYEYDPDDLDDDGEPITVVYDGDEQTAVPSAVEVGRAYRHVKVAAVNINLSPRSTAYAHLVNRYGPYVPPICWPPVHGVHPRRVCGEWRTERAAAIEHERRHAQDLHQAAIREVEELGREWALATAHAPGISVTDPPYLMLSAAHARVVLDLLRKDPE